ncbi:MAG: RNA polymerase subunit sigma-24 [Flammeovirgaceae bacterium]|nr:RNA polymerase subunit sigma-24 [Flammeovirgaceae bacterium]MBE61817.1 RNA polymerase subunit sigma-24 [Flammeovirgaceae bacterium]MBR06753.1 RNA polymerase subunit sigma-24 [Rickettsiales bacterium]|tara:strand:- start:85 stop:660 length:576 start_codon:yes stop_codon:yes gene_type:complete
MEAYSLKVKQKNEHIEQTVRDNSGRLLQFIRRFVKRDEEAEDILQDVFYQFVVGYDQIKSIDQIGSWLFRVARNKATDNHRKKKPNSFSEIQIANDDEGAIMLEDILPDTNDLPDRELLKDVIWQKIEELLAQMPKSQRDVFIQHEFEQKSFKEMSEATGDTVNTLISRKRYAILILREGLAELYNDLIID